MDTLPPRSAAADEPLRSKSPPEKQLTPKQIEIRSRESRILQLALPMVVRHGLAGLSMQAIAQEMAYAKGTIYNHFACKEEILLALAIQASATRRRLFEIAAEKPTLSRHRFAAIGVACHDFRVRFSDLFQIESMVRHEAIWDKTSLKRRDMMTTCEAQCMAVVANVGHQAVADGDVKLPRGMAVEDIVFGLWSLSFGGMLIEATSPGLDKIGIQDAFAAIRRNCHALMDGYHWEPLYDPSTDRTLVQNTRARLKRNLPSDAALMDIEPFPTQPAASTQRSTSTPEESHRER